MGPLSAAGGLWLDYYHLETHIQMKREVDRCRVDVYRNISFAEDQRLHLDRFADGGHAFASGGGGSDDGVRHAGTRRSVLGRASRVRGPRWGRGRQAVALAVGLVVGAEGAVGCGQGGALTFRTDHGSGPLQAERLQLLTGTGRKAVGDLGLWPDLEDKRRTS